MSPISAPELFSLIGSAQRSIDIQTQYIKEDQFASLLLEQVDRGIRVDVTLASACSFGRLSDSGAASLAQQLNPLVENGVNLTMYTTRNRIAGRKAYMHSKAFVIDSKRAWVGSTNISSRALFANREFGVFIDDAKSLKKLTNIVRNDQNQQANENLEQNLNCETEFGGLGR